MKPEDTDEARNLAEKEAEPSETQAAEAKAAEPKATTVQPFAPDDGYYGIFKEKPKFDTLARYRPPFNYELAGMRFRLLMDGKDDYFVNFLTGNVLEWSKFGKRRTYREYYECAKIDELTYFVNFELCSREPRTNITLVLDMEQRLVTYARTCVGFSKKLPYLCDTEIQFGVIDIPGFPLPKIRHAYTTDLVGKRIQWNYGPKVAVVHVYYCQDHIRLAFPPDRVPAPTKEELEWRSEYDEPAAYVKIKDGIYFVSANEKNRSRKGDTGNSMLFLMDLVRVHDVGRSFGHTSPRMGPIKQENYLFAAYGDFLRSDGTVEARKRTVPDD